jgi:hypothetical protein
MRVLIEPGRSRNILATIAIGEPYLRAWEEYALPGWEDYCSRHGLGLVVFDRDLLPREDTTWKKATWQKMLIGEALLKAPMDVAGVCYIDTDILISPLAPDIFESCDPASIGLVSLRRNLPFPYHDVLRRMAFLRHTCYDSSYPLDSALFMSLEQLYGYHGLPVQQDEACMGLIVFNVARHAGIMRGWFDKYDRNVQSVTNGGDQTHINYEIQNWGKVKWLDYRFQAIWAFEMAWKYPFLYQSDMAGVDQKLACMEAALYQNYFLHFAGSWHESEMWKTERLFAHQRQQEMLRSYQAYLNQPVSGEPVGMVRPG